MSRAYLTVRRSVRLAATFRHHNRTSEIEYAFPVVPSQAKRRILSRWIYPDGSSSEWAQVAYAGTLTLAQFHEWKTLLSQRKEVSL